MKRILSIIFLLCSFSGITQISDEIYQMIIKKSPKEFVNESECSFYIQIEGDHPMKYQRVYKKGYTFCFLFIDQLFSLGAYNTIVIEQTESKSIIKWLKYTYGIGGQFHVEKSKKIRIKEDEKGDI